MQPSIYLLTGPPGAGKTSLARTLLALGEFGVHLEVDTIRGMVVQGFSDSVPWTDETERQFQIAEAAMCDLAKRYQDAGFGVVIDHCRNLPRLDQVVAEHLAGRAVRKVCLLPGLEANLARNRARTNKAFDPEILTETIESVHARYTRDKDATDWIVIDNSAQEVHETISILLGQQLGG